jgi:hypothetical protein
MSVFENPSFYIAIFSSICFVASEILPFIPIEANGILHSLLLCLSKRSPVKTGDVRPPEDLDLHKLVEIKKDVDVVIEAIKNHSTE